MDNFNLKTYLLENKLYKSNKNEDVNWDDLDNNKLSSKNRSNLLDYAAILKHVHDGYIDGHFKLGKGTSARFVIDRILRNYLGSAKPAFRVSKRMVYVLKKLGFGDWTNYYMTNKEYDEVKQRLKQKYRDYIIDVFKTSNISSMQNLFRFEHLLGIADVIQALVDKKEKFKDNEEALDFMKKNTSAVFDFFPIEKDHLHGKIHNYEDFIKYDNNWKKDIKAIDKIMLFNDPKYKNLFKDDEYYSDVK